MSESKSKASKTASTNGDAGSNPTPECFVIMPLSDPDGYEKGHFRRVYEDLFIPACENSGYKAIRADEVRQTNLIHLDVLQKIINSPMALCDLSSRNPNVLFELGLRQAFDKPVVLVQEVGTPAIFDIHPLRYTDYHKDMFYRDVVDDQAAIMRAIVATKEDVGNEKSINSIVKLLSLTHPATITNISETEKDSAVLQLLMSEISSLRSEFRLSLRQKAIFPTRDLPFDVVNAEEKATLNYINEAGLEDYLTACGLPIKFVRKALRECSGPGDLYRRLLAGPKVSTAEPGFGLGSLSVISLEKPLQIAKMKLSPPKEDPNVES